MILGNLHAKMFCCFTKIPRFPMIHELFLLELEVGFVGIDKERIINVNDKNDNVMNTTLMLLCLCLLLFDSVIFFLQTAPMEHLRSKHSFSCPCCT